MSTWYTSERKAPSPSTFVLAWPTLVKTRARPPDLLGPTASTEREEERVHHRAQNVQLADSVKAMKNISTLDMRTSIAFTSLPSNLRRQARSTLHPDATPRRVDSKAKKNVFIVHQKGRFKARHLALWTSTSSSTPSTAGIITKKNVVVAAEVRHDSHPLKLCDVKPDPTREMQSMTRTPPIKRLKKALDAQFGVNGRPALTNEELSPRLWHVSDSTRPARQVVQR
ncbi:hypothetical protein EXIGLDRAFT_767943 [Exidia glandulosa HHB12029]|uniref:Uncharacterized protein n=1 Tax=Exidia glandulosa HHB12029 TaxID=1314781 RepID=A0A165IKQ1_EXIGL|nr:hypothetical protein EXIGLDRAFT_767943 [Exidia glandulosa HHB12029]